MRAACIAAAETLTESKVLAESCARTITTLDALDRIYEIAGQSSALVDLKDEANSFRSLKARVNARCFRPFGWWWWSTIHVTVETL
jgi:hypothetical protein